ncbi:MAG: MmgE/PrpD family protein [Deferrisomatales bacterium]
MEPLLSFVHEVGYGDLPGPVIAQARRCLLDLAGVAAGGSLTRLSRIVRSHAAAHFASPGGGARILFDGRRASPVGAALAGGMTLDSLDAHDGHALTKGHVGVAVLPALAAYVDAGWAASGAELLTCLVVGYEVATRAGIALHATACDYHTSGAWNALGCAAVGARLMGLEAGATRQALGIAEYHGPRSQMMRCIDHPTMLKDGSGWGAMAGVSAAYLAAEGFTGAPALTVEAPEVAEVWADLGARWRILEQYFKPYPVCRWAQPAVEAALALRRTHRVTGREIERVEVRSFQEALRLAAREPRSTEEAQYSLPFPVAAALVRGRLGPREVEGAIFRDPEILRLSRSMTLVEDPEYSARFPAERWARVTFHLADGRTISSQPCPARGDPATPLADEEIGAKYRDLAEPVLGAERAARLGAAIASLGVSEGDGAALLDELLEPPARGARL